ncbi:MAG: hypothetical protein Q8M01_04440 [Rubrivivax sp.]|nr:hypothetical protein [Rubrivivax sp.]
MPAILDLVHQQGMHGVLTLSAVRSHDDDGGRFHVRPIGPPALTTTQWIATSAQRPKGPLLTQSIGLVRELLVALWEVKE